MRVRRKPATEPSRVLRPACGTSEARRGMCPPPFWAQMGATAPEPAPLGTATTHPTQHRWLRCGCGLLFGCPFKRHKPAGRLRCIPFSRRLVYDFGVHDAVRRPLAGRAAGSGSSGLWLERYRAVLLLSARGMRATSARSTEHLLVWGRAKPQRRSWD